MNEERWSKVKSNRDRKTIIARERRKLRGRERVFLLLLILFDLVACSSLLVLMRFQIMELEEEALKMQQRCLE